VSSPDANLSAEPDVVVVTHEAIGEGRVRLAPSRTGKRRRYVEIEGAPDLIVEVLSDASVRKDTERLFRQYFIAGVREYWIVDARGSELELTIHRRGARGFVRVPSDREGFRRSAVMNVRYLFERTDGPHETWLYTLVERA
jgi:Uma2 family endonuclease